MIRLDIVSLLVMSAAPAAWQGNTTIAPLPEPDQARQYGNSVKEGKGGSRDAFEQGLLRLRVRE